VGSNLHSRHLCTALLKPVAITVIAVESVAIYIREWPDCIANSDSEFAVSQGGFEMATELICPALANV
jgi:hypothetical protein